MHSSERPILLVDDDESLRFMIAHALRDAGYRVEEATDGEDALSACAVDPPWLVITDCGMPRVTGPELIAQLAADDRLSGIPAIVMSASEQLQLGPQVIAFLEKPFAMDQMLRAIRSVADR